MPSVYVFDAYGTLFDVHSAVARHRDRIGDRIGDAERLSDLWRTKQLEYTWVRALAGAYADFAALTEQALDFAAARSGGLDPDLRADLLDAYARLDAYPDVRPALTALRDAGARLGILSNGTPAMLETAVESAGLDGLFEHVLSVDALRTYKTAPEVYRLVESQFGVARDEVSFQSSNRWDIAGAARFGFATVWINRTGQPDEYRDFAPDRVLDSLVGLSRHDT